MANLPDICVGQNFNPIKAWMTQMIACPNCRAILPVLMINTGKLHDCPQCRTRVRAEVFNAFHRPVIQGPAGEHVQEQGQAECFYHPGKKAVAPCAGCGRLLCALCEVPMDGRSLCMNCLQAGQSKGRIEKLENRRFLYDNLALYLAFWPMFFIFITPFTAPAVIYIVLRYWTAPGSLLARTRFRFVLALLMGVLQLAGWVILLVWFLSR
jgi:hypothetical protein